MPGRTSNIEVLLYDPRYNDAGISNSSAPCSWQYDSNYTDLGYNRTVYGRIQYWTGNGWREIFSGQSATARYVIYGHTECNEAGIDSKRQSGNEDFTFSLYSADSTPLDDSDNPAVTGCTKTYSANTAFERSFLGSNRWNVLCTITPSMPSGQYIMRVHNGAPGVSTADGSNQWGLVAKYQGAAGNGLCDGRTDATCPRVYGRNAISVYANTKDAVASFFLAEIEAEHNGKTLELELWDPGEGGQKIEFLQPTGANSWGAHTFSWASFEDDGTPVASGNNVTSVDVTGSKFNGRLLKIQIPLSSYTPPANNKWWKIQYTFGSGDVTDRTTWSAQVVGDPVHLVEEEAP